jgi:hypothetical protein
MLLLLLFSYLSQVPHVSVNSTAPLDLIQELQINSLNLVGSCSLWSEDSYILCVPHVNILAGHVRVVREVMEFIKDKGKKL